MGDLMTSRWAYEALAVTQFKDNAYERNFFEIEKKISYANFRNSFVIPKLETTITQLEKKEKSTIDSSKRSYYFDLLNSEITKLHAELNGKAPFFKEMNSLNSKDFNSDIAENLRDYLQKYKKYYQKQQSKLSYQKDKIYKSLIKKLGSKKALVKLKTQNQNENIENLMLNAAKVKKIVTKNGRLIQKKDPIFLEPYSHYGRAQFYASEKKIGNWQISTFAFNSLIIWLTSLLLYFTLLHNTLRKMIESNWWRNILKKIK